MRLQLLSLILTCVFIAPQLANAKGGGGPAPIIEGGVNFFAGATGKSFTGASGYSFAFRSEKRRGFFRPDIALQIDFASGEASINSSTPSFSMYGGSFLPGFNLFAFDEGKVLPFVGANGVIGWNVLKLSTDVSGVEANTKSLAYGFEVSAGVDVRFGSIRGNAIRLRTGFWSVTSSLGGISGFEHHAFKFSVGIVY